MSNIAGRVEPAWRISQGWAQRTGYILIVTGLILLLLVAAGITWLTYGIDRSAIAARQLLEQFGEIVVVHASIYSN